VGLWADGKGWGTKKGKLCKDQNRSGTWKWAELSSISSRVSKGAHIRPHLNPKPKPVYIEKGDMLARRAGSDGSGRGCIGKHNRVGINNLNNQGIHEQRVLPMGQKEREFGRGGKTGL